MPSLTTNRGICSGDKARSGVGESTQTPQDIRRVIRLWSTQELEKFLPRAKSETWRKEVHHLLMIRSGKMSELRALQVKRESRRKRRASKAKTLRFP